MNRLAIISAFLGGVKNRYMTYQDDRALRKKLEMASRVEASRLLTYQTAFIRDQGAGIMKESATAKLFASQAAVDVTRMAMQVHGAYGYMKEMDIERLYRDAKLTEIYEGVSEIQRVIIADHLLRGGG